MYYKIYPDVIFLVNMLMDYTILSVFCKLSRITTTYARLFAAAFMGALWSVIAAVCRNMPTIPELFCTYLCVPFGMTYIAGCRGGLRKQLVMLSAYMAVTIFAGGVFGFVGRKNTGWLLLAVTGVLFVQGAVPAVRFFTGCVKRKNLLYDVRLELDGRSVVTKGLFDTGNSLSDPYNGKPVCVAEKRIFDKMLCCGETEYGFRLIPYKSLGKANGLMRLVTIDSMIVEYDGKRRLYEKPEFALYDGKLSNAGEYSVILNTASLD